MRAWTMPQAHQARLQGHGQDGPSQPVIAESFPGLARASISAWQWGRFKPMGLLRDSARTRPDAASITTAPNWGLATFSREPGLLERPGHDQPPGFPTRWWLRKNGGGRVRTFTGDLVAGNWRLGREASGGPKG